MITVSFYTLGCKLNQVETEALAASFTQGGFKVVPLSEPADIVVVNTCTVTSKSEQKARRVIRKVCREAPQSIVLATGCYAEMAEKAVAELGERVFAVTLARKPYLMDLPQYLAGHKRGETSFFDQVRAFFTQLDDSEDESFRFAPTDFTFHTRAFLKIQDGCDNHCTYCRVTIARGDSRSLEAPEVIRRVQILENEGLREVVLTGVNIDSYRWKGWNLTDLIRGILKETERIRIRLSSLNPEFITEDFASLASESRICAHFHLAVQSGSDRILSLMERHYGGEKVLQAVELLRKYGDNPFMAADVITGFPSESDEDFQATYDVLKGAGFHSLHIFTYSPRPGTKAFNMKNPVPERISGERAARLKELTSTSLKEYRFSWDGLETDVLIENLEPLTGISGNYLKGLVTSSEPLVKGEVYRVKIRTKSDGSVIFKF